MHFNLFSQSFKFRQQLDSEIKMVYSKMQLGSTYASPAIGQKRTVGAKNKNAPGALRSFRCTCLAGCLAVTHGIKIIDNPATGLMRALQRRIHFSARVTFINLLARVITKVTM